MSAASVEGEADDSSAARTVIFGTGVTDHLLQQQGRGRQQDSGEERNQIKPQKKGKSVAKNRSHLFLRCPKPPKQTFNHPKGKRSRGGRRTVASSLAARVYTAIKVSAGEEIRSADCRGKEWGETLKSCCVKPVSSMSCWTAVHGRQQLSI